MNSKERAAESRSICRRILPLIPKGSTVTAYYPLKTEVDLRSLLQEFKKENIKVFLPVFDGRTLIFREFSNESELAKGELHILEPPHSSPLLDPQSLDFALVPARAFDESGWRLGRGNGGYDLWIRKQRALNPHTKIFGIAFECQVLRSVPREEHDERVDGIITARGLMETPASEAPVQRM